MTAAAIKASAISEAATFHFLAPLNSPSVGYLARIAATLNKPANHIETRQRERNDKDR